jgi:phosphoserine aminotransferase
MALPEAIRAAGGLSLPAGRVYNFNGGPAALPLSVLEEAASELLNWKGTGMSIMENSHRDKKVAAMALEAEEDLKSLLKIGDDWKVLFLQGGASLQFAMIPMNFAPDGQASDYVNTGMWSDKAYKEARIVGSDAAFAASSEADAFTYIPDSYSFRLNARYVYLTSNNTVRGTQWKAFPRKPPAPLVADMSSDFLSRSVDLSEFALIHAGAQKNVGPAGLTIAVIRKDFALEGKKGLPHLLDYRTYIDSDSMYNTPPVFAIYIAGLVFKWIKKTAGNLDRMQLDNEAKASRLYQAIDGSEGWYKGTARPDSRSVMNVTFRLPTPELEKRFIEEGKTRGLVGLNGHRSVGGIRASIYNAVPSAGVDALIEFMGDFKAANG